MNLAAIHPLVSMTQHHVSGAENSVVQSGSGSKPQQRPKRYFGPLRRLAGSLLCIGTVIWPSARVARGGDFTDEPIGARITLAKDRIQVFTDTIARQASVAYPLASATNPAADDFVRTKPADYTGYGLLITSEVFFNNGTTITGGGGIGSVRLPEAGTLSAAYVRFDSHDGQSRQGDDYVLRSNEFFLGYSHRLKEFLAVGVEVQLTDSTLKIGDTFLGFERDTESDTFGVGLDLGVLVALHETFTVGVQGGIKWDRTKTDGQVMLPAPVPIRLKDTTEISEVKLGVGWRPKPSLGIYVDLQHVHLEDDLGTTELGRMFVGTEAIISPTQALRFGGVFDTLGEAGVSAGLGYYGIEGVSVEFAYAYNTFPEVRKEFGRGHIVSFSVIWLF